MISIYNAAKRHPDDVGKTLYLTVNPTVNIAYRYLKDNGEVWVRDRDGVTMPSNLTALRLGKLLSAGEVLLVEP